MNEQEQFLKDLDNTQDDVDILDQPLTPTGATGAPEPEGEPDDEGVTGATGDNGGEDVDNDDDNDDDTDNFQPKNRRERRLLRKLQAERESSMFLSGKLEARSDAENVLTSEEADYLKGIERIYGNETPEAQLATDLLKKAIVGARDDAKREAISEYAQQRAQELEAEASAESELDDMLEEIEDTYGANLTEAQQRGYYQMLQRMSPKDRQGNVVEYADPHAVWEVFQEKLQAKGTPNRAKTLSARSMTQSGASKESTLKDDTVARYLSENGII